MTTKIPVELSSTPGIVDGSNATAITIDSSERVGILQASPTSNLHIGTSGNDSKRDLRLDGTNGSGQTYGCIIQADGENGRFVFKVGQSGNTPAQELMIHPDGGVCFGTDTAAANALDDYEEGTWTPSITGAYGAAYSTQAGTYTKIGRLVVVNFTMVVSTAPTSGSNTYITMPFTPSGSTTHSFGAPFSRVSLTASVANESAIMLSTYAGTANFYPYDRSTGAVYAAYSNWATGQYSWTGTYFTDS